VTGRRARLRLDRLALADDDHAAVGDREALAVLSGSQPIRAPSAMRTFLSMIALRTTALRPTSTPCMRMELSTVE
jgi:hypothetical protein